MKNENLKGCLSTSFAYACWGLLTVFWNLLSDVNSVYILSQRLIWSMVFMAVYLVAIRKWKSVYDIFGDSKKLITCAVAGVLVTINWGVYIYAVNSGHVLDASLGYFLEPILVTCIGMLVFREKLSRFEKITFVCSVAGLAYMVIMTKTFPVLAVLIAGSFAVYGAVKKNLEISPELSLFMETLCITPLAVVFALYADQHGMGALGVLQGASRLLLPACGVVTSIPLLMFNIGVKKIPYYVSGILMYINPTLQFFMGIFYFHEEMDRNRFIAFLIIWIGVGFTVYEKIMLMRANQKKTSICRI